MQYAIIRSFPIFSIFISVLLISQSALPQSNSPYVGLYDYLGGFMVMQLVEETPGGIIVRDVDYIPELEKVRIREGGKVYRAKKSGDMFVGTRETRQYGRQFNLPFKISFDPVSKTISIEEKRIECQNGRCNVSSRWKKPVTSGLLLNSAPPQLEPSEKGMTYLERVRKGKTLLKASEDKSYEQRIEVAEAIVDLFKPFGVLDDTYAKSMRAIENAVERNRLSAVNVAAIGEEIRNAKFPAERRSALSRLGEHAVESAAVIYADLDPAGVDSNVANDMINAADSASQIWDGLGKPASTRTKAIKLAKPLLALGGAMMSNDGKELAKSGANLLKALAPDAAGPAAGVFTGIVDQTSENLETASETLESIAAAIESPHNPENIENAIKLGEKLQRGLSGEAYGKRMLEVLLRWGLGKIPIYGPEVAQDKPPLNAFGSGESSNEIGNKIRALMPRIHYETWNRRNGKMGKFVRWEMQPVIFISRGYVEFHGLATGLYAHDFMPYKKQFQWCAEDHRVGLESVRVTYANGTVEMLGKDDLHGNHSSFKTKGRVIKELQTFQSCVGRQWSHTWEVTGY